VRDSIGGVIDLDLLSLFSQKDARNNGGNKRRKKFLKVNNVGERIEEGDLCEKRWKKV
jgi:hypothetical protein